ncbi:putative bifunctional diguanylate cyclase/phosphodiesterase [Paenibacillus sp. y28]|uniref:putative bifunctional diguanylate cyclase/phosphodiesterase n=1 Tax=Paenibacillus sp. y28 TaxID=3129110 RepID=UPI00301A5708
MILRPTRLFAACHLFLPAVLLLFFFAGTRQPVLLLLTAVSLGWTILLMSAAQQQPAVKYRMEERSAWPLWVSDFFLLALVFVIPDWSTAPTSPVWIVIFLLPFYVSELGPRQAGWYFLLSLGDVMLYHLTQPSTGFFTGQTLMLAVGMLMCIVFLGQNFSLMKRMALYDHLTSLPNREQYRQQLDHALERLRRKRGKLAVIFVDLDQFKYVNDTMGHTAGDKLLKQVSHRLKQAIPGKAILARMGGDEFTIILPGIDDQSDAARTAEALIHELQEPVQVEGQDIYVTCSIGIALCPQDGTTSHELLKHADAALYKAKEAGRNNYQFYTKVTGTLNIERITMETMLRKAIEKKEFVVYYQPRVDSMTEQIVCVEALARWVHPEQGLIMPNDFIPLAEETGLIIPIGELILKAACEQVCKWEKMGLPPLRVSVNLSPRQFQQQNLPEMIENVLHKSGLKPHRLELEITEGAAMHNIHLNILMLNMLKETGVSISIDDFGTGYSSLSYLKKLPIDALKIDRSFVSGLSQKDSDDVAIVSAIVALASHLKLRVTAEGVETQRQFMLLQEIGCNEIQGYLFGKPMPAETIEKWMELQLSGENLIL